MTWSKSQSSKNNSGMHGALITIFIALVAIIAFSLWFLRDDAPQEIQVEAESAEEAPLIEITAPAEEQLPEFDGSELQEVLDDWQQSVPGFASVVITDVNGNVLTTSNGDRIFFAASIYKLYVAYEGYRQVDSGEVDPNEVYINGNTRAECLDLMIRESDSPCAEKLWVELGKENLTDILTGYGIENTSMTNISTTSEDAAIMLARIARGEGLSESSQQALLTSMQEQIYRDALNEGFSADVIVQNKIGFRELVEYHDVAIVVFPDSRQLIVSVMTENVGSRNIANLGSMIEAAVK